MSMDLKTKGKPTKAIKLTGLLPLALAILFLTGCQFIPLLRRSTVKGQAERDSAEGALSFKSGMAKDQHHISIQELDSLTTNYADRYFMVIGSAVDAIKLGNANPEQRRIAHQINLDGVLAMNDIVSGSDPYSQTFDLVTSVTLESIVWIDENRAEEVFGDRAPILITAMRTVRTEAWDLAAKILTQEQLELLDNLILEWRRTHREVSRVAYVKFDNFSGSRAADLVTELKSGRGFLAPLSEASQVLKDWGRITERAFWYTKRTPNVAAIQAEGAVNEILSTPEITSLLDTTQRLGKTAESIPQTIDDQRKEITATLNDQREAIVATIDDEREAILADIDARETSLGRTLGDVSTIITKADSLASTVTLLSSNIQQTLETLGDTLQIADDMGKHFGFDKPSTGPPSRPFDIQEYTAALARLNEAAISIQQLSQSAEQLSRSEGWKQMLQDMTDVTDRQIDRAFTRICLLLGLAFLLAIIYRITSVQLQRRMRRVQEKP